VVDARFTHQFTFRELPRGTVCQAVMDWCLETFEDDDRTRWIIFGGVEREEKGMITQDDIDRLNREISMRRFENGRLRRETATMRGKPVVRRDEAMEVRVEYKFHPEMNYYPHHFTIAGGIFENDSDDYVESVLDLEQWCVETFGPRGNRWNMLGYGHYIFRSEKDAALFRTFWG
jgi:hypothetical protein